jgi:nicotinamidase-related amidase
MANDSRAALLLIDMQKESRYGIEGVDDAVAAAAGAIAACRAAGVPILYTRHVNRADGLGLSFGEVFDDAGAPVYYRADTEAIEVIDAIAPQPQDVVIDKRRWSGFHATSLDLTLRSLGVREVYVGGFTTDCCVLTSVYDAYALDYRISLAHDMCAATNRGSHEAAVLMMANWVYAIEILDARELARKVAGEPYRAWRGTSPDSKPFTAASLDERFESVTRGSWDERDSPTARHLPGGR